MKHSVRQISRVSMMNYVSELSKSFDSSTRTTRWQDNMWMSKLQASEMRWKPLLATVVIVDEKHRGPSVCNSFSSLFLLHPYLIFAILVSLRKITPYQLFLKPLPTAQALCSSTLWPFPFKLLAFFIVKQLVPGTVFVPQAQKWTSDWFTL